MTNSKNVHTVSMAASPMGVVPEEIHNLINSGALFVVNHSGGKDSQAMMLKVRSLVPDDQILVIHAHLPEVEWEGIEAHINDTCEGVEIRVVTAIDKNGNEKRLLQMVEDKKRFPSPSCRQCTSDLKRGPIEKAVRHYLKETGRQNLQIVQCLGLRAEESSSRAKKPVLEFSERNSKAGRQWWLWLPIHDFRTEDVFEVIRDAGQHVHWAYAAGMTRLSCCFCIMSSKADLRTAARLKPELYKRYVELEKKIGFTMMMPKKGEAPKGLEEITGIAAVSTSSEPVGRDVSHQSDNTMGCLQKRVEGFRPDLSILREPHGRERLIDGYSLEGCRGLHQMGAEYVRTISRKPRPSTFCANALRFVGDLTCVGHLTRLHNSCGLDIDHNALQSRLNRTKAEIGPYPHNVGTACQAFFPLSLWLMWYD